MEALLSEGSTLSLQTGKLLLRASGSSCATMQRLAIQQSIANARGLIYGDGACTRPCVLAGFRVGVGGRGWGGGGHNSVRPSRILFMKMMMLNMMKMMMTLMMMMLLMMTLTTFIYVYIYIYDVFVYI